MKERAILASAPVPAVSSSIIGDVSAVSVTSTFCFLGLAMPTMFLRFAEALWQNGRLQVSPMAKGAS